MGNTCSNITYTGFLINATFVENNPSTYSFDISTGNPNFPYKIAITRYQVVNSNIIYAIGFDTSICNNPTPGLCEEPLITILLTNLVPNTVIDKNNIISTDITGFQNFCTSTDDNKNWLIYFEYVYNTITYQFNIVIPQITPGISNLYALNNSKLYTLPI